MMPLSLSQWLVISFSAFLAGVSKTGVPGVGILNVPLMAMFFQAKASTGLLLPILAIADIMAVAYYRRHARWGHILKLLPWALLGIGTGAILIGKINDNQLKPLIGFIVLVMLILNYWREHSGKAIMEKIPGHWLFAASMGFIAGLTTQLANAAGPIMIIYLLAMGLPKNEFIGTGAWYFLILNWLKIPIFMYDGRISASTIKIDLATLPLIVAGGLLGIFILKKLPQEKFKATVQVLALLGALKLISSAINILA